MRVNASFKCRKERQVLLRDNNRRGFRREHFLDFLFGQTNCKTVPIMSFFQLPLNIFIHWGFLLKFIFMNEFQNQIEKKNRAAKSWLFNKGGIYFYLNCPWIYLIMSVYSLSKLWSIFGKHTAVDYQQFDKSSGK